MATTPHRPDDAEVDAGRPGWFAAFVADRATAKPSVHTLKAYRQDFDAIAARLAAGDPAYSSVAALPAAALTRDGLRAAFADYAATHKPASIRRCWSSWNVLCTFLYTGETIGSNPMPAVKQPRPGKTLPKSLGADAVTALVAALAPSPDPDTTRGTEWLERDRALVLTALLTGMRADELRRADVGDLRVDADGAAVVHVRGKGNKDRRIPVEPALVGVLDDYLDSRAVRFPARRKRATTARGAAAWPARAPLFVGADGTRITRGTLQYRVQRAFRRAGIEPDRATGALVHGLRHTYATALADAEVNVYTLMKLLGHQSMATSQRYVDAAGLDTRPAAARNPVYRMLTHDEARPGHPTE